jgi:2-iminobutanoate/2-iminopropanoate deaminase
MNRSVAVLAALLSACATTTQSEPGAREALGTFAGAASGAQRVIASDRAPKAIGPYSQAIEVPGTSLVFLAGQIPLDPATGNMVEGDVVAQTERVMQNLQAVLEAAGLGFGDVVKSTIFMVDLKEFSRVNEVYGKYFKANPPARATVQVAALPRGSLVEIEMVAVAKGGGQGRKVIASDKAPKAIGPYSQAVATGGGRLVYAAGQIPLDPASGNMVEGDVVAQADRVMQNLQAVLEAAGASFSDVVKSTIFMVDLKEFSRVNEVYGKYFPSDPPARATVQVAALPRNSLVEIEVIAAPSGGGGGGRKIVASDRAPKAIGPYSQAVEVGGGKLVYAAGQIPLDPASGNMVEGDVVAQAERVMQNLQAVLEAAGVGFGDVVKSTIFMTDLKEFGRVNEVYGKYFPSDPPARATVQVAALPRGSLVEIEVIAAK